MDPLLIGWLVAIGICLLIGWLVAIGICLLMSQGWVWSPASSWLRWPALIKFTGCRGDNRDRSTSW
jgi:hypothetical protein